MELVDLKRANRYAWHSTFAGGWELIRATKLGPASIEALLDYYGIVGEQRKRLVCKPRSEQERIASDGLQPALIRDQKPLLPVYLLERVLEGGGMSVREWCLELNPRTYTFDHSGLVRTLSVEARFAENDVVLATRPAFSSTASMRSRARRPAIFVKPDTSHALVDTSTYPTEAVPNQPRMLGERVSHRRRCYRAPEKPLDGRMNVTQ